MRSPSFSLFARGFSLVEMMSILVILTAIAAVGSRVLTVTMGMYRDARQAEHRTARASAAIRLIRTDAWAAAQATLDGDRTLTLTMPGNQTITWDWSSTHGQLQRWDAADDSPTRTIDCESPPSFTVAHGQLYVEVHGQAAPLIGPLLEVRP